MCLIFLKDDCTWTIPNERLKFTIPLPLFPLGWTKVSCSITFQKTSIKVYISNLHLLGSWPCAFSEFFLKVVYIVLKLLGIEQ